MPLEEWISRAQNGDTCAVEALLTQFRPLLRSRTYELWAAISDQLSSLEWVDVEADVTFLFLSRLQSFRLHEGVYFPHYIERMLYFDGLAWLRKQRQGNVIAVPFSQLGVPDETDQNEVEDWLFSEVDDPAGNIEQTLSLRNALEQLSASHKHLVWQCCVLGRTEDEMARQLEISRSSVRKQLAAALVQLRDYFDIPQSVGAQTGRVLSRTNPREFWSFILTMAKDEKRPDLVGVGSGRPVLLQGTFDFPATGIRKPQLLSEKLRYVVPTGTIAGIRFVRAGVICDTMVSLSTVVNGLPHRLIPIAANTSVYVPLAIVEALPAGSEVEIHIASDTSGTIIIDVGCLQMPV